MEETNTACGRDVSGRSGKIDTDQRQAWSFAGRIGPLATMIERRDPMTNPLMNPAVLLFAAMVASFALVLLYVSIEEAFSR